MMVATALNMRMMAFRDGRWMSMLEDRNLSVHTCDERTAEQIFGRFGDYAELMKELVVVLEKTIGEGEEA